MEYIYAAMLLHKAGKPIDEDNITKVLEAAGIQIDPARVKALVAALSEVDIDEAIKSAPTVVAAAPATAPTETAPAAEEKPKEEEKPEEEEKKEEEALEGLGALFG
ncbi:50S ribosomal protein P1 [Candidatus Bathyarchaeota archaeon]|nr:50S ribosomal protein P1 [Candidatus Bathyarchaeota archaeon]RLG96130.1 MAG: 50S ribosomal protein P1 [Candidatus Bathyarchaeota archaeon]